MNHYQKRSIGLLLLGGLFFSACSDNAQPENEKKQQNYSLVIRSAGASGYDTSEELEDVDVYCFSDGEFYGIQTVAPAGDGSCTVSAYPGSHLYFMTGLHIECEDGTSEKDFLAIPAGGELHDGIAPEFMTSSVALAYGSMPSGQADALVYMVRGVARVDLNTTADPKTVIDRVTIEGVPDKTFPFGNNNAVPDGRSDIERTFEPAFSGRAEGIFRLFESDAPVDILLHGSYDGVPVVLKTSLPGIERNKIYELRILNIGADVEASFDIRQWEEGETVVGKPDSGQRILIDASKSDIPDGVSLDAGSNIVEVPESGVSEMTLAFSGDTAVDIASVEGSDGSVSVGEVSVREENGTVVSSFKVSVAAQGSGRLAYSVFVHLRNALMTGTYDYVEIRVSESANQIYTVEMAGSVWMAFNARSNDLEDQVYPLDGLSVEDMYVRNWINTVGGLFQFGRRYMYVPWQGYNPSNNLGNQTADVPWQNDTHMPCPDGYRIPSRAELESLLPKGTSIPGTYTAGNGETITATLHVGEGTLQTPTKVTGTQHFVKFVSRESGNTLFIPLAGGKGDKATTNNPAFGKRAILWASGRDGCPGGYAWAYWLPFEGNATTTIAERQLQMEAFASVRCVKK